MKNLLKNNKGLTLVELLAVVVIMGVLSSIAVTSVSKLLSRSAKNYYKDQEDNVALAAQSYTNDNRNLLPFKTGSENSVEIKLKTLQDAGYIKTVKDKSGGECSPDDSYVTITKNSTEDYTYKTHLKCSGYETVSLNNIDEVSPVVTSCQGIIKNNRTTYTIASSDNNISKIYLDDNKVNLSSNSFSVDGAFENATIEVYDVAGNKSYANCSAYYDYNRPSDVENTIFNVETSTLKVLIDKRIRDSRTEYYVTHVWARNPYYQFKSNVPDKYGEELLNASTLLTNAVNRNNLNNKLAVAVNASGFVLRSNNWNTGLSDYNLEFEKTSVTPFVRVEGEKKRDFSKEFSRDLNADKVKSNHYTYGLKKDGWFGYYKPNNSDSSDIIKDGVLNTFGFNPVLVDDGDIKVTADVRNIRQGLCQIDKNNFVFISDVYDQGRTGFSYLEMAKYMVSLGCKIGFNLDGGGSVSLIVKPANSDPEVITGNTRDIADIVYFHEQ